MDLNQKYWVLIQRFVTGAADRDEKRILDKWMDLDSENRKLVQEIKEIWKLTPSEDFDVDVQTAWNEFHKRKELTRHNAPKKADFVTRKPSKMPLYILRLAAVVLVSVFAGVFVQYTLTNNGEAGQISEFYVMQNFETEKGEKARITFSDGTKVVLNSASSIRFPQEFSGAKREVYLKGEAYFEVAHDSDHPFIVYAHDAEVQVLGTEFNVQAWRDDGSVEVVVREGKVSVGSLNSDLKEPARVILTDGLYTNIKNGKAPGPAKEVNVKNRLIWTHGGLHFENAPFSKVIRDLERRFNVEFTVVDEELMDISYTGIFIYAELDEVIAVIAASMDFEYDRDGSKIIIQ
ncbi:FecR family protein [Rhodohalobacter sp. 8-1]|uniref:FecR family protein n=1 Tax=Rhodohalobacter sp. 8-1 TaxID=3131972 RepID=UPI0030EECFE0